MWQFFPALCTSRERQDSLLLSRSPPPPDWMWHHAAPSLSVQKDCCCRNTPVVVGNDRPSAAIHPPSQSVGQVRWQVGVQSVTITETEKKRCYTALRSLICIKTLVIMIMTTRLTDLRWSDAIKNGVKVNKNGELFLFFLFLVFQSALLLLFYVVPAGFPRPKAYPFQLLYCGCCWRMGLSNGMYKMSSLTIAVFFWPGQSC